MTPSRRARTAPTRTALLGAGLSGASRLPAHVTRVLFAALLVFAALGLAPSAARAQPDEALERARAQFGEGVELIAQERWGEALARFRAVAEVRATPQVLYNLALARANTEGGAPEAARILARVLQDPEADAATRERSRALLAQVRPDVAQLRIGIRGDEAGVRVYLDDEEITLAQIGRPYPVAPGSHVLELRWGRRVRDRQQVSVAAGALEEVELDAQGTWQEDQLEASLEPSAAPRDEELTERWWFWAAIGAGAAVVLGLVIGFSASAASEQPDPITGNLRPSIIRVMP